MKVLRVGIMVVALLSAVRAQGQDDDISDDISDDGGNGVPGDTDDGVGGAPSTPPPPTAFSCPAGQFQCATVNHCIDYGWTCDGQPNL